MLAAFDGQKPCHSAHLNHGVLRHPHDLRRQELVSGVIGGVVVPDGSFVRGYKQAQLLSLVLVMCQAPTKSAPFALRRPPARVTTTGRRPSRPSWSGEEDGTPGASAGRLQGLGSYGLRATGDGRQLRFPSVGVILLSCA